MDTLKLSLDRLCLALGTLRLAPAWSEYEIHDAVKACLQAHDIAFVHEAALGPRCRADFLVEGCIVLEVKKGRPSPSVYTSQVERYLAFCEVGALVLLAERQLRLPKTIQGKPCLALSLSQFWGIAL